jgi:hypothetical protein
MNTFFRIIFKLFLTLVIILFFSGVFRGCSSSAQTSAGRGIGMLFATIIFIGSLYGVWSYSPKEKTTDSEITLKKD